MRKELARRSHTASEEWKSKMADAEERLMLQAEDQRDVSAGNHYYVIRVVTKVITLVFFGKYI